MGSDGSSIKVQADVVLDVVSGIRALASQCGQYTTFEVEFSQGKGPQVEGYNAAAQAVRSLAKAQMALLNSIADEILDDTEQFCQLDSFIAACLRGSGGDQ